MADSTGRISTDGFYWPIPPSYPASHTDDCFQPTVVFRPDRRSYWNSSRSIVSSSVDGLPHFSSRRSRFTSTRERQSFSEAYPSRPDRDLDIGVHSASFIHGSCTPTPLSDCWLLIGWPGSLLPVIGCCSLFPCVHVWKPVFADFGPGVQACV